MLISCNKLKTYIKNSDDIDFKKVWDLFTLRTAEVENVYEVGNNFDGVVVGEIISCENHPDSDHMHVLKIMADKEYDVVCGAPNVKVGLKTTFVLPGGRIGDIEITPRKLRGVLSNGMCASGAELDITSDNDGIMELPSTFENGKDIKEILPINDIIVEIDNKSLTNRPDLWGHYGIAREICAITNHELLNLDYLEVKNNKQDLDIKINNPELCYRYCGITIDNINNNKTPLDMQIFLHYVGLRSINLLVDLTNYLMIELGQPMHAFDKRVVKSLEVGLAKDGDTYTTLDGVERSLTLNNLMIKNGDKYFAVAGVMGGLDSEILPDTNSVFLESACFNAGSVRKTAVALGLRTDASARYEKSLDPNMCDKSLKRLLYLLAKENPDMEISSNLTDIYPTKLNESHIALSKEKLAKYIGKELEDDFVKDILEKLEFKVEVLKNTYDVTVPTFRHTKDINIEEDLIEEIARFYGLENFTGKPLELKLDGTVKENIYDQEYEVKELLATKYDMNEVHSYLWYDTKMLNETGINKDGVKLLGKDSNNILRDDLSLSLLNIVNENFKNYSNFEIFEIGTKIINNQNKRALSIIFANEDKYIECIYNKAKEVSKYLFKILKNKNVDIIQNNEVCEYYDSSLSKKIVIDDKVYGFINVFANKVVNKLSKKKCVISMEIDFDKYVELEKESILAKEVSKYPEIELDYTIIAKNQEKYIDVKNTCLSYNENYIKEFKLIDIYHDKDIIKYTIRFIIGSNDKTLNQQDINTFKEKFINIVRENGLDIIE